MSERLPREPSNSPLAPVPARRARAAVPVVIGGLALAAPWLTGAESAAVAVIGVLGGLAVWRADARSTLDAWQRRWPGLPLAKVRAFPDGSGRSALERLLTDAQPLPPQLAERPWRERRRRRRELAFVLQAAAQLAMQLQAVDRSDHPALAGRAAAITEQLALLTRSLRRLSAALERAELGARPDLAPLLELDRAARDIDAHAAGREELARLEDPRWTA